MKIMYLLPAVVLAFALTTTSCKKADEKTVAEVAVAMDMETAKGSIKAGHTEFETAFNAKDATALANCYTSDAKLMGPDSKSVEGRANIAKMFGEWFKGDTPKIKLNLVEAWGNEAHLTAESTYEMSMGGEVIDTGKAIEVYKKEDGKWRMLRDCYNSDMPPPPPAK